MIRESENKCIAGQENNNTWHISASINDQVSTLKEQFVKTGNKSSQQLDCNAFFFSHGANLRASEGRGHAHDSVGAIFVCFDCSCQPNRPSQMHRLAKPTTNMSRPPMVFQILLKSSQTAYTSWVFDFLPSWRGCLTCRVRTFENRYGWLSRRGKTCTEPYLIPIHAKKDDSGNIFTPITECGEKVVSRRTM